MITNISEIPRMGVAKETLLLPEAPKALSTILVTTEDNTTSPAAMTTISTTPEVSEDTSAQTEATPEAIRSIIKPSSLFREIPDDMPTCQITVISPADFEDKMAHGFGEKERIFDEPSEALLNSPEYRDSMIAKPEDLFDASADLINELRNIIAEKDAELEEKDRIIETLRGVNDCNIDHVATGQDGETEQAEQTAPDEKSASIERITIMVKELAKLLGIGENMAYNLVKEDGFPAIQSSGKYWIFKDKVEDWFLEHPEIVLKSTNTKSKKSSKKETEAKAEKKSTKASAKKKEKTGAKKKSASKTSPEAAA